LRAFEQNTYFLLVDLQFGLHPDHGYLSLFGDAEHLALSFLESKKLSLNRYFNHFLFKKEKVILDLETKYKLTFNDLMTFSSRKIYLRKGHKFRDDGEYGSGYAWYNGDKGHRCITEFDQPYNNRYSFDNYPLNYYSFNTEKRQWDIQIEEIQHLNEFKETKAEEA
jgi:hypothetical protein